MFDRGAALRAPRVVRHRGVVVGQGNRCNVKFFFNLGHIHSVSVFLKRAMFGVKLLHDVRRSRAGHHRKGTRPKCLASSTAATSTPRPTADHSRTTSEPLGAKSQRMAKPIARLPNPQSAVLAAKGDRTALAWTAGHDKRASGTSASNSSTAESTVSAREAM